MGEGQKTIEKSAGVVQALVLEDRTKIRTWERSTEGLSV